MSLLNRREVRRLAMQVLYQIDATGQTDAAEIATDLDAEHDPAPVRAAAVELALAAWHDRTTADEKVAVLAPDWPTHRQPPVDRAILRLAYHEMATGRTPAKVAVNEAVELAKQYSNEHAPAFINGVLDKLMRTLPAELLAAGNAQTAAKPAPAPAAAPTADDWLADAQ